MAKSIRHRMLPWWSDQLLPLRRPLEPWFVSLSKPMHSLFCLFCEPPHIVSGYSFQLKYTHFWFLKNPNLSGTVQLLQCCYFQHYCLCKEPKTMSEDLNVCVNVTLTSCVTQSKLLNCSELQSLLYRMGILPQPKLTRLLWRLTEISKAAYCLACNCDNKYKIFLKLP